MSSRTFRRSTVFPRWHRSDRTPAPSCTVTFSRAARARYLDFARDADQPAIRARMIGLAGKLGWLSPGEQRTELMQMIGDRVAKNAVSPGDVDLVCTLNKDGSLDDELDRLQLSPA